jgi:hypothetical protein
MSGSGYQVSPAALQETAKGITDSIDALKGLGIDGTADAGRGFSDMSLRGMQVGHAGLQNTFDEFLSRWSWGVRTLVQDGNQIAQQLGLNAGAYADAEQYATGVFKDLTADVMGDPHLTDSQVESRSWSQVLADNPIHDLTHPDYSAGSWSQAGQHIAQTWQAEGRDMANGPMGLTQQAADAMGIGQQFNHAEDEVFGPTSPQGPPSQQGGS